MCMEMEYDDKEVMENLEKVIKQLLPEAIKQGMTKACLIVQRSAKQKCPVDDGTLRASIRYEASEEQGIIGTNTEYAPYVHEGTGIYAKEGNGRQTPWVYKTAKGEYYTTSGQKPQPFLKDAANENIQNIIECFENLL